MKEKIFTVINTTEYNDDGKWLVTTSPMSNMSNLGFGGNIDRLEALPIGGVAKDWDFHGVRVVRVA